MTSHAWKCSYTLTFWLINVLSGNFQTGLSSVICFNIFTFPKEIDAVHPDGRSMLCGLCGCLDVWGWTLKIQLLSAPQPLQLNREHGPKQAQAARCTITDESNETDSWKQRKPIPPVKSDMIWFHASHKEKEFQRSTMFGTKRRHFHRDPDTFYETLSTA